MCTQIKRLVNNTLYDRCYTWAVLSPLLFILNMDGFRATQPNYHLVKYTDDTVLLTLLSGPWHDQGKALQECSTSLGNSVSLESEKTSYWESVIASSAGSTPPACNTENGYGAPSAYAVRLVGLPVRSLSYVSDQQLALKIISDTSHALNSACEWLPYKHQEERHLCSKICLLLSSWHPRHHIITSFTSPPLPLTQTFSDLIWSDLSHFCTLLFVM